jgi:hypothetical protein
VSNRPSHASYRTDTARSSSRVGLARILGLESASSLTDPVSHGVRRRPGSGPVLQGRREQDRKVAVLFVHKAALDAPSWPETIAKTYKLTPTELRALLAVVEVGGVPNAAEALGIGESTHCRHGLNNLLCQWLIGRSAGSPNQ